MKRFIASFLLAGALFTPVSLAAENWTDLDRIALKGDDLDKIYTAGKYAKQSDAKKMGYGIKAANWYEQAAKHGCVPAMMALAQICEAGKIIDRDEARALEWYQKAAGLGEIAAYIALGDLFNKTKKNPVEAAKWYKKAAEKGDVPTQSLYGDLCLKGLGVPVDAIEAKKWYLKAAEKGHAAAMFMLGTLFEQGKIGAAPDFVQAHVWFDLACRYGQQSFVQEFKERSGLKLSKEQFIEANRLADENAKKIEQQNGRR